MLPEFVDGDRVLIEYPKKERIMAGRCIIYNNKGGVLVFHRILKIIKNFLLVKGDNENYIDKIIFRDVIGVYAGYKNNLSFISHN